MKVPVITLMVKAVSISETSVSFYDTAGATTLRDSRLHVGLGV
jgi:hypothetical protein